MKLAAIDIGSNACRLLLMNVYETPEGPYFYKNSIYRVALRLGEESFLNGKISEEKIIALVKTIKAFKNLIEVHGVESYRACATSAMREASNSKKIVERIKEKTGVKLEIISGDNEADIIFDNHSEKMLSEEGDHNYLYIDVGGGSTEMILMNDSELVDKWSFDIGTLRLKHDMVTQKTWNQMRAWLYQFRNQYSPLKGIGSGGNINHILKNYSNNKDQTLSLDIIETCYRMLKVIPDMDKQIKLGMGEDRADVIVPALEIFRKVMGWANMEEIYVPKVGLPDGIIKSLYKDIKESAMAAGK